MTRNYDAQPEPQKRLASPAAHEVTAIRSLALQGKRERETLRCASNSLQFDVCDDVKSVTFPFFLFAYLSIHLSL